MVAANIITAVAGMLWTLLALLGSSLSIGVAERRIAGYPNAAQLTYYIGVPVSIVVLLALAAIVFNARRWPAAYLGTISGVMIFLVVPYLFSYAGGV